MFRATAVLMVIATGLSEPAAAILSMRGPVARGRLLRALETVRGQATESVMNKQDCAHVFERGRMSIAPPRDVDDTEQGAQTDHVEVISTTMRLL